MKIAIVGGGPAALAICYSLISSLKELKLSAIEIAVFEKSDVIGPGLPYSMQEDSYILNLPVGAMGACLDHKDDFTRWIRERSETYNAFSFPPRCFFGSYLQDLAGRLIEEANKIGVKLNFFQNHEITNIINSEKKENYFLFVGDKQFEADFIVLATGHMPSSNYEELMGIKGYRENPWTKNAYDNLDPDEPIAILGSRLSAIDIALQLKARKHQGKILMFSRSGLMPAVLAKDVTPCALKYLTLDNFTQCTKMDIEYLKLSDLLKLFWSELSEAEGTEIGFNNIKKSSKEISALEWIDKEIRLTESGTKSWQQILFSLYPIVPNIWAMLSYSDQKEFMEKYYSLFLTYLAAFPLDNAYHIQEMLKSKQLLVIGGLKSIAVKDNQFVISADNMDYFVNNIFNATGPGYNPCKLPLYQKMYQSGLIKKHDLGGIMVNHRTLQVQDSEENLQPRLYAVGELTRGSCLATTDMTRVMFQVNRITSQIINQLQSKKPEQKFNPIKVNQSALFKTNSMCFFKEASVLKCVTAAVAIGGMVVGTSLYLNSKR